MKHVKTKEYIGIFWTVTFIFLLVFFTRLHPLMIYDSDDWTYIAKFRKPIPSLKEYNPGKVFPETFQRLMSCVARICVYPLTHDFIGSISIVYGTTFCLFVLLYLWEFYRYIQWINPSMKKSYICVFTALFLLFHFSIFKNKPNNNNYLFLAGDLNCYYNYTVPTLMNATMVLYLLRNRFELDSSFIKKLILIICGYLCIFSNVFMTGILMSAIGIDLIVSLVQKVKCGDNLSSFFKERWFSFVVLFFWIIDLYFESHGGRANDVGKQFDLYNSFRNFVLWGKSLNIITAIVLIIGFLTSGIFYKKNMQEKSFKTFIYLIAAFILESAFLIVICAKTGAAYILRIETIFGVVFYIFIMWFTGVSSVVSKYPKAMVLLTLSGLLIFGNVSIGKHIFAESCDSVEPSKAKLVDDDILNQVLSAYNQEKSNMVLRVPKGNETDNWPHATYMGERINHTLNKLRIIDRNMNIKIKPDLSMNKKYKLGY